MNIAGELYRLYPRHLAPHEAIKAIEKTLKRLPGELRQEGVQVGNETEWLKERVELFKESDAGKNDGLFLGYKPPYPATWFNKQRYLDDVSEWFKNGTHCEHLAENKPQAGRVDISEKADPDCEECAGIGYASSKTNPGTLEACVCTLAQGTDRHLGTDDSLGFKRPTQARLEGFEEIPARTLGASANGRGAGKV